MDLKKNYGRISGVNNPHRINTYKNILIDDTIPTSLIERFKDNYMVSTLPSTLQSNPKDYSPEALKKDLEYLDIKLETVRKTITSWDVYNILGVAEKPEDIDQLLNTLTPNSSFIVNTDKTYIDTNNKEYSIGDIIFQDITGVNHIIKAQGAGVFFPQKLIKQGNSNTYELTYTFSNTIPNNKESFERMYQGGDGNLPNIAYQMQAKVDITDEAQPYGFRDILSKDKIKSDPIIIKDNIQPVIYTFIIDSTNNKRERIWLDDSCYSYKNGQIIISNEPSTIKDIYIEVR